MGRDLEEYLVGYVYGDGNLYYDKAKGSYRIRMYDSSRQFLESLASIISSTYGVKITVSRRKTENLYIASLYSKYLYDKLTKLIDEMRKDPTLPFIRGLLDAEGYCYVRYRGLNTDLEIGMASKDVELLRRVHKVLRMYDIKASVSIRPFARPSRTVGYLRTFGYTNSCRLFALTYPHHPRFLKLTLACPPPP